MYAILYYNIIYYTIHIHCVTMFIRLLYTLYILLYTYTYTHKHAIYLLYIHAICTGKETLIKQWSKEEVQRYHNLHYRPDNVILFVIGKVITIVVSLNIYI